MVRWAGRVLAAGWALGCAALASAAGLAGPELAVGLFQHGSRIHPLGDRLIFPKLPAGEIYEGEEERGSADVQIVYRSAQLRWALQPRLTGKVQINTAGRTSFGSIGAEWRQHVLHRRLYGQIGIGLSVQDGYRFTPDPFAPGLSIAEVRRRYAIYRTRTGFGSRILFNPNASLGVRLNARYAIEATWEHFSHRQTFSDQNPGMDSFGLRIVRAFGR